MGGRSAGYKRLLREARETSIGGEIVHHVTRRLLPMRQHHVNRVAANSYWDELSASSPLVGLQFSCGLQVNYKAIGKHQLRSATDLLQPALQSGCYEPVRGGHTDSPEIVKTA